MTEHNAETTSVSDSSQYSIGTVLDFVNGVQGKAKQRQRSVLEE